MRKHIRVVHLAEVTLKGVLLLGLLLGIFGTSSFALHAWVAKTQPFGSFPSLGFFMASVPTAMMIVLTMLFSMWIAFALWSLTFVRWVPMRTQRALVRRILLRGAAGRHGLWILGHAPWRSF